MNTSTAIRAALAVLFAFGVGASQLACNVNDYCLNCGTDDGGTGSGDGDANDGGGGDDAPTDAACVPTGVELCDSKDNDCNGLVDDGVIDGVGDLCTNQFGACAGGVLACTGGALKCDRLPRGETCDGIDNDCDNVIDDGDPGGGAKCGTDFGTCVAGTERCQGGQLVCIGFQDFRNSPEVCDGQDNNCNDLFDEGPGLANMGTCGPSTDAGECAIGTLQCQGGAPKCVGAVFPKFEICNGLDDDCDSNPSGPAGNGVDEIFNFQTDPLNCGGCGALNSARICAVASKTCDNATNNGAPCTTATECMGTNPAKACVTNSQPRCTGGTCGIRCNVGFINLDTNTANGCEYKCSPTGNEECDGVDNDCDGLVDEQLTPPVGLCKQGGACGTTTATCAGANSWVCNYPANVEIAGERSCDNVDNDCDLNIDESHKPDGNNHVKAAACDDGEVGVCLDTGTYICNPTDPLAALQCSLTTNSPGPAAFEDCNAKDDDCDGDVDEDLDVTGATGREWVAISGGVQMMKYEASRPDATDVDDGITSATVCSRLDRKPWTNVTYAQASATCTAIGARLCTEQEWHRTCSVVANTRPTGALNTTTGTLFEAEDYSGIAFTATKSWVPDYTAPTNGTTTSAFSGISALEATPSTGTSIAVGSVATAPRLDYSLSFPGVADTRVWVRMFANNPSDDTLHVRIGATTNTAVAAAVGSCVTNAGCPNGSTCIDVNNDGTKDTCTPVWQWVSAGSFGTPTGTQNLSVFMGDDGVKIDQIWIVAGGATPPTTISPKGNTWAYASAPDTYAPNTCNGSDYDTVPGGANDDDVIATGDLAACYADLDGAGTMQHVFDMSGNVKEWTAARQAEQNPIRGGASNNSAVGISCALNFTLADDTFKLPNIGFRCCK